ncbi:MAG: pantetheine-phosphate adenylyltransferase [Candidatus Saelkia tenebricola]|nr:pantetheine-phosphate adenylyltransferase [Candidatus Saelkia tenebricola]
MKKRAIYPGTFDPLTYGHLDIIKRGLCLFDEIIIAVADVTGKDALFNLKERVEIVEEVTRDCKGIKVESFNGLVVDFADKKNIRIILRGLRMISDFEYEFQMALTNRRLAPRIETIFMMPNEKYSYISSRLIKEVSLLGADISHFIPPYVEKVLKLKFKEKRKCKS